SLWIETESEQPNPRWTGELHERRIHRATLVPRSCNRSISVIPGSALGTHSAQVGQNASLMAPPRSASRLQTDFDWSGLEFASPGSIRLHSMKPGAATMPSGNRRRNANQGHHRNGGLGQRMHESAQQMGQHVQEGTENMGHQLREGYDSARGEMSRYYGR